MLHNRETRETTGRRTTTVPASRPTATFRVILRDNKPYLELDPSASHYAVSLNSTNHDIYIDWEHATDSASLVFLADDSDIQQLAGLQVGLLEDEMTERSETLHFACRCDSEKQTMFFELYRPAFVTSSIAYSLTLFALDSSGSLRYHDPKIYNQGPK